MTVFFASLQHFINIPLAFITVFVQLAQKEKKKKKKKCTGRAPFIMPNIKLRIDVHVQLLSGIGGEKEGENSESISCMLTLVNLIYRVLKTGN